MSELTKCPRCGERLEKGYLDVRSGGALELYYVGEKPSFWDLQGRGEMLLKGWGEKAAEAYRCKACKLVVFEYSMKAKRSATNDGQKE